MHIKFILYCYIFGVTVHDARDGESERQGKVVSVLVNDLLNDFTYSLQMTSTCRLERRRERTRYERWREYVKQTGKIC